MLQLAHTEPAIHHAMLAIGYFYEQETPTNDKESTGGVSKKSCKDSGLREYNKALQCLVDRINSGKQSRVASLTTCVLFVCLELLRGNVSTSMQHLKSGLNILAEMHNARFLPLELAGHCSSFSYGTDDLDSEFVTATLVPIYARMTTMSAFMGGGYWQLYPAEAVVDMSIPRIFVDWVQARAYLVDLVNLSLQFIGTMMHKQMTSAPILFSDTIRQTKLHAWLKDWNQALETFESNKVPKRDPARFSAAAALRMQYYVIWIWLSTCASGLEIAYAAYTTEFIAIVALAENIIALDIRSERGFSFSFDTEVVGPLFWAAMKCRDLRTRRRAINLLSRLQRREGLWNPQNCCIIADRLVTLEESTVGEEGVSHASAEESRVHIQIEAKNLEPDAECDGAVLISAAKGRATNQLLQVEYAKTRSSKYGMRAYGTWIFGHLK